MDFNKLSTNHWIAGGGALATLISLFLDWQGPFSAFNIGLPAWLNGLIIVAAGVLAMLYAMDVFELSFWKLSGYDVPLLGGIAATFQLLLWFLESTSVIEIGFFLGLAGGVAVVVGIILEMRSPSTPSMGGGGDVSTF